MNCLWGFIHDYVTTMWLSFSVFDEHVRRSKVGGGNSREMDFESFLDFVLALENKDTPEGLTYLFRCLDLNGRGFLTTADIHTLFRYVIMYGLIYTIWLFGSVLLARYQFTVWSDRVVSCLGTAARINSQRYLIRYYTTTKLLLDRCYPFPSRSVKELKR